MLQKLIRRLTKAGAQSDAGRMRRKNLVAFRPRLEPLEERCCLSTAVVRIDPPSTTIAENGGVGEFTVTRSGALANPFGEGHTVDVWYRVNRERTDTARYGKDYKIIKQGVLRFSTSDTEKKIRIEGVDDPRDEPDETVSIHLTKIKVSKKAEGLFENKVATAIIRDDDAPPFLSIKDRSLTVKESAGGETFTFMLSEKSEKEIVVDYELTALDENLKIGTDVAVLGRPNAGTITIKPGKTKVNFKIKIIQDKIVEDNERFFIEAHPRDGGFGDTVLVTILDDDKATVAIKALVNPKQHSGFEGKEGEFTFVTLQIVLSNDTEKSVTVNYTTQDGSADFKDYVSQTGSVLFPAGLKGSDPGKIKTISLFINGDDEKEKTETFFVDLIEDKSNLRILRKRVAVVIVDDD